MEVWKKTSKPANFKYSISTIQCSQASRLPCRHLQDSSPGRLGRLSQAVGKGLPSSGKEYRPLGNTTVLWEKLPSKRVTVGPYSPLSIGNSRTVSAVLARHLQSSPITCSLRQLPVGSADYLQGSSITCKAHPSPRVIRRNGPPETPAVPASSSREVIHTEAKIAIRPGHPLRYCDPSRPDSKTDGLDAWED